MNCSICDKVLDNIHNKKIHEISCIKIYEIKDEIVRLYVDELYSIANLSELFKIGKVKIIQIIGDKKRNRLEGRMASKIRYPEPYKHTEDCKKIMSEKRLKWIKENPEKTAWRQSNMSYPEKVFLEKIKELKWSEKYLIVLEKSIYPYFIDFAFENEKVALEIDGSQHLLPERVDSDLKKDNLLKDNGWRIIRITAKEIISNLDNIIPEIEKFLESDILYTKVGILKESKKYIKKTKRNFLTKLELELKFSQRKVKRPSYEVLLEDIKNTNYFQTGKKYNVSDNCIRKWIKMYEKHGIDY